MNNFDLFNKGLDTTYKEDCDSQSSGFGQQNDIGIMKPNVVEKNLWESKSQPRYGAFSENEMLMN